MLEVRTDGETFWTGSLEKICHEAYFDHGCGCNGDIGATGRPNGRIRFAPGESRRRGTGPSERDVGFPTLEQRTEDIAAVDAVGTYSGVAFS